MSPEASGNPSGTGGICPVLEGKGESDVWRERRFQKLQCIEGIRKLLSFELKLVSLRWKLR